MFLDVTPDIGQRDRKQRRATAREAEAPQGFLDGLMASPRKRDLVVCILLAIATFALYTPALGDPFIFNYDDASYVTDNAHVQAGLVWETVVWSLRSTEASNWHPLTWLSHALDCELYGLNPAGHHFTNVLIHALNAVLLFLLLVWATGAVKRSLLVAALFAAHPFNVESVAFVAERKNVLSTFFFLLTLGAYGWYALRPNIKRYAVMASLFVLGLASKPMVVTLPCVLMLLDFWPLRRIQGWGPSSHEGSNGSASVAQESLWRLVLEKLPLLGMSAAACAITIFAQRSGGSIHLVLPLGVRLENAIVAYAMYVWKTFWPSPLTIFYPHPGASLAVWQIGLAALFLASVSTLVWKNCISRPYLVTGWLWFLGTLVPVIGLIQVGEQAMADRYAYVPLIGIFLMVVWGAADLAASKRLSLRTDVKIAAIVLGTLSLLTVDQLRYWHSSYDLWAHAVDVTKNNFVAEENLGAPLLVLDRSEEAVTHLRNAVRIRPWEPAGHLTLAGALVYSGHTKDAIAEYEIAIPRTTNPNMQAVAYETLGRLYSGIGNYDQARVSYQQALKINPQQASAAEGLAKVEFSDAMRNAAESPSGQSYLRLGQILQQQGRIPEARAAYEQALDLAPKLGEAKKALDSLKESGKPDDKHSQ
jgi:protein O-mannosyl-transferase